MASSESAPPPEGSSSDDDDAPNAPGPRPSASKTVRSCAGLTYFSSSMRAQGRAPLCLGRRGAVACASSQQAVLERAAKSAEHARAAEADFSFACLGYSQTTARMERDGALPLCDVGMRFTVLRAAKRDAPAEAAAAVDGAVETTPPAQHQQQQQQQKPLADKLRPFFEKTLQSVARFWKRGLEDFPNKFTTFSGKLVTSMQKQAAYLGKLVVRLSRDVLSWWLPRN